MIVFKTFLKVLNKCKTPIIMYTVFLIFFGGFRLQTEDNSTNFVATKPDVFIVNYDESVGITKSLIEYMEKTSNIISIKETEEAMNDALFYRDVSYIIEIPKNYRNDFLSSKNPKIEVKKTGDYEASLAEMQLERYLHLASLYHESGMSEEDIIKNIEDTLAKEVEVEITSKLDTSRLKKATSYYNFANYCILAGGIYVICLILSSFRNEAIQKRTIISSMNIKEYNLKLLLSNSLFAFVLWAFYVGLSFILLGDIMFSIQGVYYMFNSFLFTFCAVTIAFLIGNLVHNKNAINGIVNVIALGSSFLCGAFVPMEFLPETVLNSSKVLPSYWYIKTNELLSELEVLTSDTIKPILVNMGVLILFSCLFIILTNLVSKRKRKIG